MSIAPLAAGVADTVVRVGGNPAILRPGTLVTLGNDVPTQVATTVSRVDGDLVHVGALPAQLDLAGTNPTLSVATYTLASGTANITANNGPELTVDDASPFAAGDQVTDGVATATVISIAGTVVTVDTNLAGGTLTIVDLTPDRNRFRVLDHRGLTPGMAVRLTDGGGAETHAVISQVSTSGLVTLAPNPTRTSTITAGGSMEVVEFAMTVTDGIVVESFTGLSMNPTSANHFLSGVASDLVVVSEPDQPFLAPIEQQTPADVAGVPLSAGVVGNPATLGVADYQDALDALRRVDEVNLICAPDAATLAADIRRAVHSAIIGHCIDQGDRIAIIDPPPGLAPSGDGSIEEVRQDVQSERGFATLYYPWFQILDPTRVPPQAPRRISIPPSGHVAGVMARVDAERGVFKAPANVTVRDVLGVERQITDREQAPLNRGGTNVLRVLPGTTQVTVWGARTTVDPVITDWMYVNVRRLLLFIEESIQESIRWAVFEPNDLGLWKSLERIIKAFLREQWKAGALFGASEEDAFLVRIDEGLNPPEVRNVGRLNIEIRVAPVRPAEYIVINIGLFDGGAQVEEA